MVSLWGDGLALVPQPEENRLNVGPGRAASPPRSARKPHRAWSRRVGAIVDAPEVEEESGGVPLQELGLRVALGTFIPSMITSVRNFVYELPDSNHSGIGKKTVLVSSEWSSRFSWVDFRMEERAPSMVGATVAEK